MVSPSDYESLSREERIRRIGAILGKAVTLRLERERVARECSGEVPPAPDGARPSGHELSVPDVPDESLASDELTLMRKVSTLGYPNKVVSQFKFGTDHVADFVAMSAYSGALCVHLVELEPPGAQLFTKAGVPAKHLNTALTQVANWRTFVEKNRPAVLLELGKAFKQRELVFGRGTEPTDTTGMPLHDPRQQVTWYYHVAIGRRAKLSREELERRNALLLQTEINVMTYDRLLESAKAVDDAGEAPYFLRPARRMSAEEVWDGLKKQAKAGGNRLSPKGATGAVAS